MRHARDHFELLLDTLNSPPPYVFSYDSRKRNTPMETSRASAYEALSSTISRINDLSLACQRHSQSDRDFLTVHGRKIDLDEAITLNAVTPTMQALQSSFGRELWFTSLHAVHHWSMIRVIAGEQVSPVPANYRRTDRLKPQKNIKIDGSFGVAPSTLVYRETKSKI